MAEDAIYQDEIGVPFLIFELKERFFEQLKELRYCLKEILRLLKLSKIVTLKLQVNFFSSFLKLELDKQFLHLGNAFVV